MIRGLIERGHAYAAGGDVYFDITKDGDYGKLCNRDPEQLEAGARIEVSDKKRSPGDFALWKSAKPGEPAWDSPWGPGRPGWHIECSVMSMKYLGETLDIHGGGLDLQFPHHENELAQSESYTGKPFARVWMHNGLLKMGHAKMAGSVGNVVNIADLLQKHHPETIRFLLLATHYRSPIEYSDERLTEVAKALDRFYEFFRRYERITSESFYDLPVNKLDEVVIRGSLAKEFLASREKFVDCMNDDFNTGGAVGVLFELLTALNRFAHPLESGSPNPDSLADFELGVRILRELTHLLGLFHEPRIIHQGLGDTITFKGVFSPEVVPSLDGIKTLILELGGELPVDPDASLNDYLQRLIDMRTKARNAKNFALADQIRKRLGELGVTLEDRPGGKTIPRIG
jgi:cysteinyl-tRNA synthetase